MGWENDKKQSLLQYNESQRAITVALMLYPAHPPQMLHCNLASVAYTICFCIDCAIQAIT